MVNGRVSEVDAVKGEITVWGGGADDEGVIKVESGDFGVAGEFFEGLKRESLRD